MSRTQSVEKTNLTTFGETARSLARNPLGIIALFIVLIYGIAGLVFTVSSANLTASQRWTLICFIVIFPIVVLFGFLWLVVNHSHKLYAPSDFRKDDSFVELNKKVSILTIRQAANEIYPRAETNPAFDALQALLDAQQIDAAKNLAKAFLKVKRFDVSLQMFDTIISRGSNKSNFLRYRAYSLIGLKRYDRAINDLQARHINNLRSYTGFAFAHFGQ